MNEQIEALWAARWLIAALVAIGVAAAVADWMFGGDAR